MSILEFTSTDVIVLVIDMSVQVILCSLVLTEFKAHVGVFFEGTYTSISEAKNSSQKTTLLAFEGKIKT